MVHVCIGIIIIIVVIIIDIIVCGHVIYAPLKFFILKNMHVSWGLINSWGRINFSNMETQKIDPLNFWYHWNWLKFKDNYWKWHHSFISNTINQQATFHITGWHVSIHAHTHSLIQLVLFTEQILFLTAENFLHQTEKQLMKMQCNTSEMHLHTWTTLKLARVWILGVCVHIHTNSYGLFIWIYLDTR